jgi:hypothetical protein
MILLVGDARAQWAELDRRISAFDAEFVGWAKENEEARRLTTFPASARSSALVAAVGRAESFDRGRDLAAWLVSSRGGSPRAANRCSSRPDTLKQTDQPAISAKPLADGAGHTSLELTPSRRKKRLIIEVSAFTPRSAKSQSQSAWSVASGFFRPSGFEKLTMRVALSRLVPAPPSRRPRTRPPPTLRKFDA